MSATFQLATPSTLEISTKHTVFIGTKENLLRKSIVAQVPKSLQKTWSFIIEGLHPGSKGDSTTTWIPAEQPVQLAVIALPNSNSRHNSSAHPHCITALLQKCASFKEDQQLILSLNQESEIFSSLLAVSRVFPTYSQKTNKTENNSITSLFLFGSEGAIIGDPSLLVSMEAVRCAGKLVDMPTSELHTDALVEKAQQVSKQLQTECKVIQGKELEKQGFGGLWAVGKAAVRPPALVVLSHKPNGASQNIVWVGKGIVYDTGGLSIKGKTGMPGMKRDMGGAAAVLMAFQAAVRNGFSENLTAVLCIAENAVSPESFRPDDILHMYSGKTVEVNNTDAEGRLVLADGVAYASKHLAPDVIIDLATLTGAQSLSTGKKHAAIICNDLELEQEACEKGRFSGDLVHPLPYCPEFFLSEFKSQVADMKNSVKNRMNAQASCAAHFIEEHLVDYKGKWLHVDIEGPSKNNGRGTGFGVGFLLSLLPSS